MPERMSDTDLDRYIIDYWGDRMGSAPQGKVLTEAIRARASETALLEQVARLEGAIRWALGEGDSDFPGTEYPGRGQFGWRVKLHRLAALQPKAPPCPDPK
jgi:hypothetical protein